MTAPDTVYFARHGTSLYPVDDAARAWLHKHGAGEIIAFDQPKRKDRDAKDHRRFFALIRVGFENQPESDICASIGIPYFDSPDEFRHAWTAECGHVDTWLDLQGQLHIAPRSLAYNETTQDELLGLARTMCEKWIRTYGPEWTEGVVDEVSRLTGGGNW